MANYTLAHRLPRFDRAHGKSGGTRLPIQLEAGGSSQDLTALVSSSGSELRVLLQDRSLTADRRRRLAQALAGGGAQGPTVALVPLNKSGEQVLKGVLRVQTRSGVFLRLPRPAATESRRSEQKGAGARDGAAAPSMPTIAAEAYTPSAKALARLRGMEIMAEDLRKGEGCFDIEQTRAALNGISRQAVSDKVQRGKLLAVPGPGNQRRYPAFQFVAGGVLPGLDRVLAALPSTDPWYRLHWLVNPDSRLGDRSPVDQLKAGEADLVVGAAQRVGEMGA